MWYQNAICASCKPLIALIIIHIIYTYDFVIIYWQGVFMGVVIKMGSRESKLARVQVTEARALLQSLVPALAFEPVWFSSPGDRDQETDLQEAPADFFTRDLDTAVLDGSIDCALHSAKDFPDPVPDGIDWFWLPCGHDTRDVLVGSANPRVVGVSSDRRRAYVRKAFPEATLKPLRGTIGRRLEQWERGDYDAVIMAGVALQRLGLEACITRWIPLEELATPAGQGSLLVAFRVGDRRLQRLRALFVRPVVLASAGTSVETCSMAAVESLRRAEVCLYDALLDPRLLHYLPTRAEKVYVGKRSGKHSYSQQDICAQLTSLARMGRRVVRLKGGDAGIYGRLAEEVDALDVLALPFRVLPGVSSVVSATTATGLLLTRRGIADRIHILSGHSESAHHPKSDGSQTEVIFMGTRCLDAIVSERLACGYALSTPVAVVWSAGLPGEKIVCGRLADIVVAVRGVEAGDAPGLILIGAAVAEQYRYRQHGALGGMRVWLTCSEDVQARACEAVRDYGGIPLSLPLVRLVAEDAAVAWHAYDWLVVTSPAAVRCLLARELDVRRLPKILCCGPGTAAALRLAHLYPDAQPDGVFSTEGVLEEARRVMAKGAKVLRVRSDRAGTGLADALRSNGFVVDDVVISRNQTVQVTKPEFDAILFASASAVDAFLAQFGAAALHDRLVGVMGHKEIGAMQKAGLQAPRLPAGFTLPGAVATMAGQMVEEDFA
jgi:uroporphyrinogen III methyltransferase / synthase